MAKEKGEVVGVVREWQPQHTTNLTHIESAIDSWDRAPGDEPRPRPTRDYAAIEAAVDRITKRVKTRKVVVTETVTEYVDEEGPVEVHAASASHVVDATSNGTNDDAGSAEAKPAKLGWFARRKQAKAQKTRPEPVFNIVAPTAPAAQTTTVAHAEGDAWDPSTVRQVEPTKPLQSKAAKRTAGKPAKKSGRKKR